MSSRTIARARAEIDSSALSSPHGDPRPGTMCRPESSPSQKISAARSRALERFKHYVAQPILRLGPLVFGAAVLAALYIGWRYRDEDYLTPETGAGYWLGITGGVMMLLLLLYPLRKRIRLLHRFGHVPWWFRAHMLFGVLGPTLILFHCNFSVGSLNSSVALISMFTVVASGIIGRYLYAKVHMGLYGSKADVAAIVGDTRLLKDALGVELGEADELFAVLREFEQLTLKSRRGFLASLWAFLRAGVHAKRYQNRLQRMARGIMDRRSKEHRWSRSERRRRLKAVRVELALYFAAVNKAARFSVYERLFAMWHVLHLPLFLLLVITAVVHVVAVHQF